MLKNHICSFGKLPSVDPVLSCSYMFLFLVFHESVMCFSILLDCTTLLCNS